jgi:hypothetical protein
MPPPNNLADHLHRFSTDQNFFFRDEIGRNSGSAALQRAPTPPPNNLANHLHRFSTDQNFFFKDEIGRNGGSAGQEIRGLIQVITS